jgi:hypothetical protein
MTRSPSSDTVQFTVIYNDATYRLTVPVGMRFSELFAIYQAEDPTLPDLGTVRVHWVQAAKAVQMAADFAFRHEHNKGKFRLRSRRADSARAPRPPRETAAFRRDEFNVAIEIGARSYDFRIRPAFLIGEIPSKIYFVLRLSGYRPDLGVISVAHDGTETELLDLDRVSDVDWDRIARLRIDRVAVISAFVEFMNSRERTRVALKPYIRVSQIGFFVKQTFQKWLLDRMKYSTVS